ncbi:hypothetical protein KDM41_16870, partial [bacterium]|nr:hypothetical protein [bacterium]
APPAGVAPRAVFTSSAAPNPFNPRIRIAWEMPRAGRLVLEVYDVRGRRVRTLVDGEVAAGPGAIMWDGADTEGRPLASGVYFRVARTGSERQVGKMTLVR